MNYLQRTALYTSTTLAILSAGCNSGQIIDGYKVERTSSETVFVHSDRTDPAEGGFFPVILIDKGNDGTIDSKTHYVGTPLRGFINDNKVTEAERRAVEDISKRL